jgi:predicted transposase/invertase (TIGR01784 family)
MAAETSPVIAKAYGVLKELSADEATRLLAESREKAFFDDLSRYEEAMEEGLEKGARDKALEVAKGLLSKGMSLSDITELTKLSLAEVKRLAMQDDPDHGPTN